MRVVVFVLASIVLASCGPNPQMGVIPQSDMGPQVIDAAQRVRVLPEGASTAQIRKSLGPVTATSCKNKTWDKPATRGDALLQLRIKASQMGANAIMNVLYDQHGTDAWGTNCWESITASGDAVVISGQ